MQHYIEQVPDGVKATIAVSSPVLAIFGYPVEQWGFVLSALVALLFIVEKIPMLITRLRQLGAWINDQRKKRTEASRCK